MITIFLRTNARTRGRTTRKHNYSSCPAPISVGGIKMKSYASHLRVAMSMNGFTADVFSGWKQMNLEYWQLTLSPTLYTFDHCNLLVKSP